MSFETLEFFHHSNIEQFDDLILTAEASQFPFLFHFKSVILFLWPWMVDKVDPDLGSQSFTKLSLLLEARRDL